MGRVSSKTATPEFIVDFDVFTDSLPVIPVKESKTKLREGKQFKTGTRLRRVSKEAKLSVEQRVKQIVSHQGITRGDSRSSIDSTTEYARSIIINEITGLDKYNHLVTLIEQCKLNIAKFTKVNDSDEIVFWKGELNKYRGQLEIYKEIMSIHNPTNYGLVLRSVTGKTKRSPEVIAAQYKVDCAREALRKNSPTFLVEQMREIREQINMRNLHDSYIVHDLDSELPEEEMFSGDNLDDIGKLSTLDFIDLDSEESLQTTDDVKNIIECPDNTLLTKYDNLCKEIGSIIGATMNEVADMKLGTILSQLKIHLTKTEELEQNLQNAQIELMNARNQNTLDSLKNNYGVCEMIYDNYDLNKPEDEKKVRELLASIYIRTVKGIAYNIVSKRNKLSMYEDAVGYGMLGLALAINKWVALQKQERRQVIEFKGFCNTFVAGAIKSGFIESISMGCASTSHIQRQNMITNKRIDNFVRFNPQYKNLDREELLKLVGDEDMFMGNVSFMYESQYAGMQENDNGGNDLWSNITQSKDDLVKYTESKHDHQLLMRSIKELLNLFETAKDRVTGETYETGRKIFDRYDTRLFEMAFGFAYKHDGTMGQFTQQEMAEELRKMYKEQGINKTFSQPAIVSRINTIKRKIITCVESNKKLKRAFEYINQRWNENPDYMWLVSNERESEGTSFCPPPRFLFKTVNQTVEEHRNSVMQIPVEDCYEEPMQTENLDILQPETINV